MVAGLPAVFLPPLCAPRTLKTPGVLNHPPQVDHMDGLVDCQLLHLVEDPVTVVDPLQQVLVANSSELLHLLCT